jgi:hypothetical protein
LSVPEKNRKEPDSKVFARNPLISHETAKEKSLEILGKVWKKLGISLEKFGNLWKSLEKFGARAP